MQDFEGRTAVITGGASGIGYAMAERFGREGMNVVLADIEEGLLADAEKSLGEIDGVGEVLAVATDVRHAEQVEALREAASARFGAVHLLCNNAGVGVGGSTSWDLSLDDWTWCIEVNLWGVVHGIRAFVPGMLEHGEGAHIVNTASMAGHMAAPSLGPYNVTKFGVVALSETMQSELAMTGADVNVSVLCPGFVATRIGESERVRPSDRAGSSLSDDERSQREQMGSAMIAMSTPPAEIADIVFDAVGEGRFWILPHAYFEPILEARWSAIRDSLGPIQDSPFA